MDKKLAIAISLLAIIIVLSGVAQASRVPTEEGMETWRQNLQDWQELKLTFAKALPYVMVLGIIVGIALGILRKKIGKVEKIIDGEVKRHHISVVLEHWTHTVGCIICVITAALLLLGTRFGWVAVFPKFMLAYKLHFIGAGIFVFASLAYIVHHVIAGDRAILPSTGDIKGAIAEIATIMGFVDEKGPKGPFKGLLEKVGVEKPPHAGKWLPIERLETPVWGVLVGAIIITGIVKTLRYTRELSPSMIYIATKLHVIVGILILLLLIVHIITAAVI
ncbi:MAG: cytochrome b/b6 domain-containing protein, partial [Methanocellales archaeon]|nr:cytochrome b/b6 domain-containing protein [Methanocellales archaeon]